MIHSDQLDTPGRTKPQVYETTTVPAPVDAVWKVIRDFARADRWLPSVNRVEMDGDSSEVGSTRRLFIGPDDDMVAETLLTLDDAELSMEYTIVDPGNIPVRNYHATVRVRPVANGGGTFVEWFSTFDTDPVDEQDLVSGFTASTVDGLRALTELFAARP